MKIICNKISKYYPNTIYGLINNLNNGFKSFTIDIHTCKNEIILYHDNYFNGYPIKDLYINDFIHNGMCYMNTFTDFINITKKYNNINFFFNIKSNDTNIIDYILSVYSSLNPNNNYYFHSFNYKFIRKLKKYNKSIKCGLYLNCLIPIRKKLLNYIDYLCILEDYYTYYVKYNKDIYLSNINNNIYYKHYINHDIKGIITDNPEIF